MYENERMYEKKQWKKSYDYNSLIVNHIHIPIYTES